MTKKNSKQGKPAPRPEKPPRKIIKEGNGAKLQEGGKGKSGKPTLRTKE